MSRRTSQQDVTTTKKQADEAIEQAAEEEELEERAAEAVQPDIVDEESAMATEELKQMSAYAGDLGGGVTYRILPQISREGAQWVAIFYLQGTQGPVLQSRRLTAEQAADLGATEAERQQINTMLEKANNQLEVPRSLRGQPTETKPISALEQTLED